MAITAEEFDLWADRHGSMFGFSTDRDAATFAAWFEVFEACGYSAGELRDATDVIARRSEPLAWRSEHLAAIHSHVRQFRRAVETGHRRIPGADQSEVGECTLCVNSGWVSVPHPEFVLAGRWESAPMGYSVRAVVYCRCWAGRKTLAAWNEATPKFQAEHPRAYTLDEYETKVCPKWRTLLAAEEAALAKAIKSKVVASAVDEQTGQLPKPAWNGQLKIAATEPAEGETDAPF